jgi:hypothetical protein
MVMDDMDTLQARNIRLGAKDEYKNLKAQPKFSTWDDDHIWP